MRRSIGTIDDLGDGRFRVRVPAGYDPDTGKRVRLTETVRGSRRDAERLLAVMLMRTGRSSSAKLTVVSFMEDVWLPTKDSRRRTTIRGYESKIASCIAPYIGQIGLTDLDAYVVERWLVDLKRAGKGPQTIRHARAVLKNGMRAAVRWKLIDRDPTEGTEVPVVDYEPTVLSGEQMTAYANLFRGSPIEPVVIVQISTGSRRCEATALDWSDIDFETGEVDITKGLHQEGSDVWPEEPKSKDSRRRVGMPPAALERLRELRGIGALVPDAGGRMAPEKIARIYRKTLYASDLPYVPMRDLRNSHGTLLYDSGLSIDEIADQLGHSDTQVTRQHYVSRSHRQANRAAVAAISSVFAAQFGPNSEAKHGRNPQEPENGQSITSDGSR